MKNEKMRLIINVSKIKSGKDNKQAVFMILKKFIENVPEESINSSTFTLALDALEKKSDIFLIEHRSAEANPKIQTEFEYL